MTLEEDVVRAYAARRARLALAESVTGGLVASRLTRVDGASEALVASLVTYRDEAKARLLGVDTHHLAAEGAVTPLVAKQMAQGARRRTGADVAVSLTGLAGPRAPPGLPVGLVFLGLATRRATTVIERRYRPLGRRAVQDAAAEDALALALAALDAT